MALWAVMPVCVLAQNTLTKATNLMRNADTVNYQSMEYSYQRDNGKDAVWDFSDIDGLDEEYPLSFVIDTLGNYMMEDDNGLSTYSLFSDLLKRTREENRLQRIVYHQPKLAMKYPLQYGDSLSLPFSGAGTYCGDHHIRVSGQVNIQADGLGTLILPRLDTLHNALRVYTLTSTSIAMDMDSISLDTARIRQEIAERYDWYVRGYRYPLYGTVLRTSYSGLTPVAKRQCAYSLQPDGLLYASADVANDSILHNDSISRDKQARAEKNIIHYTVDVYGSTVSLNYTLDEDASVTSLVSSVMGIIYRQNRRNSKAGEGGTIQFDCSGLRRGQYILYINVNGKVYNEKVNLE